MQRWPYTFAVLLSAAVGTTAIVASQILDLPIQEPDSYLGPWYVTFPIIVALFFAAGIIPSAVKRGGWSDISRSVRATIRDEWSGRRLLYVVAGLGSFYTCYISYRNLKSFLPIIRENVLNDTLMLRLDHFLMFGNNPAEILHDILGTGIAAHVLSAFYISYLALVPITLGAFLVWSKDLTIGAWYATALSLNWVLGVVSYYLLPTLGPAFAQPQSFLALPETGVSVLQNSLARARFDVLADPWASERIHGIAGFASLHVSVVVTAGIFFHRIGMRAIVRYTAWAFLVITVLATIYFGWHYIADDVAGALIGWLAVTIAAWATGNQGRHFGNSTTASADTSNDDGLADPSHALP